MRYPTINQYIDALTQSELFLQRLKGVELTLSDKGAPIYSSGNFGVVFKVLFKGKSYALKCFTREQLGRAEAYSKICPVLPKSKHLIKVEYLNYEIMSAPHGEELLSSYDALIMEYVEGQTLANELYRAINNMESELICSLSIRFNELALWLLNQDFAHGDLKPENVVVGKNSALVIVDYDGLYTPQMRGERQREIGTRAYQHPRRAEMLHCKEIDHYSILLISVSLYALAIDPSCFYKYNSTCSSLVINPDDAVAGNSAILEYLEECKIIPSDIISLLKSKTPVLEGLEMAVKTMLQLSLELDRNLKNCAMAELLPFESNSLWGYENQAGEEVIIAKFEMAWEFDSEGLALVKLRGKYGYINMSGEYEIKPRFAYASSFSEGYAVAAIKGRYGYIDRSGRWVVKPVYSFARTIRNGIARVEKGNELFEFTILSHE